MSNCRVSEGLQITVSGLQLTLFPQRALYIESLNSLFVSDVHLGKSETFQAFGIPIANAINQATLTRLQTLCWALQPDHLFILGDLFHSPYALVNEVLESWFDFLTSIDADVEVILGNHDRALASRLEQLSIQCRTDAIQIDQLVLSHEPNPQPNTLNLCGHVHPCVRFHTRLDHLRLPCFYRDHADNTLILPSFGDFTGGHEMPLTPTITTYVIAEESVIPVAGSSLNRFR